MPSIPKYMEPTAEAIDDRRKLLRRLKRQHYEVNWNEHQTRYALIDPILKALGWDISNPMQVTIEASNSSGDKADYLLYSNGYSRPRVVVEAKRATLGDIDATFEYEGVESPDWMEWDARTIEQVERYWKRYKPRFAVLTNGIFWAIYDLPNARGKIENKRSNYSNILSQDPGEYMDSLKRLHRTHGD